MNFTELQHAALMTKVQWCSSRDWVIDFVFDMPDIVEFVSGRDRAAGLESPFCCLFVQEWEGFVGIATYIVRAEILTDVLTKTPDFWGMSIGI